MSENSVDSIVTDPPYGLAFMGKKWDYDVPSVEVWREVFRVLKPGGHLLSFGGTRTYHRMVVNIEDSGFEIRDQIQWLYGSGFPKSLDISKAIDKQAGVKGEAYIDQDFLRRNPTDNADGVFDSGLKDGAAGAIRFKPATPDAKKWQGFGTALKPANEIICLARKPLTEACVVTNLVLEICQSQLIANAVKKIFELSQRESSVELNIAQWLAGKSTLTPGDLFDLTGMWQYESATTSNLSTELLWLNTLVEILQSVNTFTTETATSLITDLRILKSLLSKTTLKNTPQNDGHGEPFNASLVTNFFNALALKLNCIHALSVQGSATEKDALSNLHPNSSPIVLARKPLSEKTVAENVLRWGTGGLNIDGCRIATDEKLQASTTKLPKYGGSSYFESKTIAEPSKQNSQGRFPANLILGCECIIGHSGLDEHDKDCVVAELDRQSGITKSAGGGALGFFNNTNKNNCMGSGDKDFYKPIKNGVGMGKGDVGGASRFFYVAKASRSERNRGLDKFYCAKLIESCEENTELVQLLLRAILELIPNLSIAESGDHIMVTCPKGFLSTTKTTIQLITELKTWNWLIQSLISGCILDANSEGVRGLNPVQSANDLNEWMNQTGISLAKAGSLTTDVVNATLKKLSKLNETDAWQILQCFHPTVKPIRLMRYLCRLVTPPGGTVLDPFMGSGTTGIAAKEEGFEFIGIELEPSYFEIAQRRINVTHNIIQ